MGKGHFYGGSTAGTFDVDGTPIFDKGPEFPREKRPSQKRWSENPGTRSRRAYRGEEAPQSGLDFLSQMRRSIQKRPSYQLVARASERSEG